MSPLFPPHHIIVELNEKHHDMLDLLAAAYPDSVARRQAELIIYMGAVTAMDRTIERIRTLQQDALQHAEINRVLRATDVQRRPSDDEQP
jgi:hypothetical protein